MIDGAMVSRSPHVKTCLSILDSACVEYDVISWNRRGDDISSLPGNYHIYNHKTNDYYPSYRKFFEIIRFCIYSIDIIKRGDYRSIIIFEIANSLFFYHFLKKYFKNKYILDIRDYSPVCKIRLANYYLKKLICNSHRTVISSEGFKAWLPKWNKYVISHNISPKLLNKYKDSIYISPKSPIRLLTIGNLRDPNTNCDFLRRFENDTNYMLYFVGDGYAQPIIQQCCKERGINNVVFYGHYHKEDETEFYINSEFINCCMDDNDVNRCLMSNRIYLSVLLKKPIICLRGSFQSAIVEQYCLGVVVDDINDVKIVLEQYMANFNKEEYLCGCERFLINVAKDQETYINEIVNFTKEYDV